jgi:hypothetical protein
MHELPRDRPHFYLHDVGRPERYTTRQRPRTPPPPERNREAHARALEQALNAALGAVNERIATHAESDDQAGGFYLQFEMPAGQEQFVQNLEDRRRRIELVAVRQEPGPDTPITATVFVPYAAANYLQRKLEVYRTELTAKGKPRHENLINRIDSVALAAIRSVFTDEANRLPAEDQEIWWEVWIRAGLLQQFSSTCQV